MGLWILANKIRQALDTGLILCQNHADPPRHLLSPVITGLTKMVGLTRFCGIDVVLMEQF